MPAYSKTAVWLLLAIVCVRATKDDSVESAEGKNGTAGEILKASETADPKKVEIVKQIRRLNNDGSYTVGYEAGDGTFKIESRDVLGNVKGTFGYIDDDGEIKRVTYSSSNSSTPIPVQVTTSTTPSSAKSVASTTRRPLATVVYPRSSSSTRGTVIQPIPRKRPSISMPGHSNDMESTTDMKEKISETTTNNLQNVYKPKLDEAFMKPIKMQMIKPAVDSISPIEVLQAKSTSTEASSRTLHTVKPVYEHVTEKEALKQSVKINQFRRQLSGTSHDNPQMHSLQQSAGGDSTDVYGSHLSLGTVRPLFTTTTTRPRLVPFTSILAHRQKLQDHIQRVDSEHETTIEASTGRVFDHENVVTSNPVPVVHIPTHRDRGDERIYQQPIYRRPSYPNVQFRTTEYLRDNPGAPIPIGNQRPYLNFDYQSHQEADTQFLRESTPQPETASARAVPPEVATPAPYGQRSVTRVIPIAVDERGVPIPGYRFASNPFEAPTTPVPQPRPMRPPLLQTVADDMHSITTPVSTRDLKRLLQVLLIRQNRLQALMDEVSNPGPPYQPLHLYRQSETYDRQQQYPAPSPNQVNYQNYVQPRQYNLIQPANEPPQYNNYRSQYQQQATYDSRQELAQQGELFTNQITSYESNPQYESQRYVPRRRLFTRLQYDQPPYDTDGANSNHVSESPDYLPPDIREALLLKMLMLAISPEYVPVPEIARNVAPRVHVPQNQPTEMTTAAPVYRKQVRNVQILGEEGSKDDMKRRAMQLH